MVTVNIHEAKTQLSKLVDRAAKGEPFIIAKAGKPLVKVVALDAPKRPQRLSAAARRLLNDPDNTLVFSAASLWEIAITHTRGRDDFRVEPRVLRRRLLDSGYVELPVTSDHVVNIDALAALHRDPFDRLLLAQAQTEGITLLTFDARLARYPGSVRKV